MWAPGASLIVVNVAHVFVEETDGWEYSEFSRYDLGQAVAHMTIQGLAMGWIHASSVPSIARPWRVSSTCHPTSR